MFHLAAILGVKTTMEKSIELIETNFDGTRNILQAALKGKKKVVLRLLQKYMVRQSRPSLKKEIDYTVQLLKYVGVMQFVKR